ncbi:MAG: DUF3352 domain-containing protein [Anaerolineae bacterium]|nr:DUF3352 domain-containing protein [Anaerolineae bacterium]
MSEDNEMMENMAGFEGNGEDETGESRRKKSWLGGGALAAALIGVAAIALFVIFDPFGWIDRIFGGGDKVVQVVPEDTAVYLSIDLLKTTTTTGLDDIVRTFVDASGGDTEELASVVDVIDDFLQESYAFTFNEDIKPWIGQYAGMAYSGLGIFEMGLPADESYSVFIVEVRDSSGADEFMERYLAVVEENDLGGGEFEPTEYEGVTIHVLEGRFGTQSAVARVGGYLVFGDKPESIHWVIDTQKSNSLGDSAGYRDVMKKLPRQRFATAYVDLKQFEEMGSSFNTLGVSSGTETEFEYYGMAFSFELTDQGIQMEFAQSIDEEGMVSDELLSLQAAPIRSDADEMLPADTFLYMAATGETPAVEGRQAAIGEAMEDEEFAEALELLVEEYGIDLEDVLQAISGEVVAAMMPSDSGALAAMGGMPAGFLFMIGTSDEDAIFEMIEEINGQILDDPLSEYSVEDASFDDLRLFNLGIENPFIGGSIPMLTYGVGEGFIILASGIDVIEDTFDGGPSLADQDDYQGVWTGFLSEAIPFLYLDLHNMVTTLESGLLGMAPPGTDTGTEVIRPLHYIVMVIESREQDFPTFKMLFIIEKEADE